MADKETDVRVTLGADNADADAGLKDTVNKLNQAVDAMTAQLQKLQSANAATRRSVEESNAGIGNSFQQLSAKVEGVHNTMIQAFTRIQGGLAALTAALAGGEAFEKFISDTREFTGEVMKLARTMGIASDEATTLVVALNSVGVNADTYTSAYIKFERQLRRNSDSLKALGVDTDALKNGTKTSQEVFEEAIQVIGRYKEGHDRLQVAMQILGTRGINDINGLLRLTKERMEEARQEQEALGLTVTKQSLAMQVAYRTSMADIHEVSTAVGKVIAETMMPRLTEMGEWFKSVGPTAVVVMKYAMEGFVVVLDSIKAVVSSLWTVFQAAFKAIGDLIVSIFGSGGSGLTAMQFFRNALAVVEVAVIAFRTAFQEAFELIRGVIVTTGIDIDRFAQTARLALSGDFSGAIAAWKNYGDKAQAEIDRTWTSIKTINAKGVEDMKAALARALEPEKTAKAEGDVIKPQDGLTAPPDLGKMNKAKDDRLAMWRDELRQKQEELGYFNEMSKADEAKFWEDHLAMVTSNSKEDIALRRTLSRMIYDDKKSFAREEQALEVQKLNEEIAANRFSTDRKIQLARQLAEFQRQTWGENSKQYQAALANETKLKQQQVEELMQLEKTYAEMKKTQALADLAMEEANFNLEVELGHVTADKKYATLVDYENRRFAIEEKAMRDEIALMVVGENATYEQKAQALLRLEGLIKDHEAKVLKIKNDAIKEGQKYEMQAIDATRSALEKLSADLVQHPKDWKKAFMDFFTSLDQQLVKIAANKVFEDLLGPGTKGGGVLSDIFGKIFGTKASTTGSAGATAADAALQQLATVSQQNVAEMSQLVAQQTAQVAQYTALDAVTTTVNTSFAGLTAAADQAAAALSQVGASGASGAGGSGLGDLFSGGGGNAFDAFSEVGIAFQRGTNWVPRNMVAALHEGEAVIPREWNLQHMLGGNRNVSQKNYYNFSAPTDTRTQNQMAATQSRLLRRATYRGI